jgi:hypothetical protein
MVWQCCVEVSLQPIHTAANSLPAGSIHQIILQPSLACGGGGGDRIGVKPNDPEKLIMVPQPIQYRHNWWSVQKMSITKVYISYDIIKFNIC